MSFSEQPSTNLRSPIERRIELACAAIFVVTIALWWFFELGLGVFLLAALLAVVIVCVWVRWYLLALAIVGLLIPMSAVDLESSFQIQPATGELRYLVWGIPYEYESPDAITRQALLSAQLADLPMGWYEQRDDKRRISTSYFIGYCLVADCLTHDEEIGRLFYRDLANEAAGHRREEGRFPFIFDIQNNRPALLPHWKATPYIIPFLRAHDYSDQDICRVMLPEIIKTIGDGDRQQSDDAVSCVIVLGPPAREALAALETALQSAPPERRDLLQRAIESVGGNR